jgi:hypothetical protein
VTEEAQETLRKIPPEAAEQEAKGVAGAPATDSGTAEAKQLGRGLSVRDLKAEATESEHGRAERFKNHFEFIALAAMWGVSFVAAAFGFTWFWHVITPDKWHWLQPDQVEKIQNIFAGVILAGVLGDHFKRRLGG